MFAQREIRRILTDTWHRQGWQVPEAVTNYECHVLLSMLDRVPWQPEPSYAERYLKIRSINEAIEFGNVCWFTRAVFPDCLKRRGLKESYFTELGQSSWDRAIRITNDATLIMMRDYFDWTAEMTYTAVHSEGEFRSLWD